MIFLKIIDYFLGELLKLYMKESIYLENAINIGLFLSIFYFPLWFLSNNLLLQGS